MRNFVTLFVFCFLFSGLLNAQKVSYTADDLAEIGDVFEKVKVKYDTVDWVPVADVDPALWNFSDIETTYEKTTEILSKDEFEETADLPAGTMLMEGNDSSYVCLQLEGNTLNVLGYLVLWTNDSYKPMIFSEPQVYLAFPLTIGDTHQSTGTFEMTGTPEEFGIDEPYLDSIRMVVDFEATTTVEDTGTLTTGIFELPAFKVMSTSNSLTDVYVKPVGGDWYLYDEDLVGDSLKDIQFFNPGYGIPVCEVSLSEDDKIKSFSMIDDPQAIPMFAQGNDIQVYPNPARQGQTICFSKPLSDVALFDMSGRKVWTTDKRVTEITLPGTSKGCYLLNANELKQARKLYVH